MFYEQAINGAMSSNNVGPTAHALQSIPASLPLQSQLPPPAPLPSVHHQFNTNPYFGFFPQTTLASQQQAAPPPLPPPQGFNFSSQHRQNSQDFLNSSQTEKSWLNSSLNEKNWLNNSLNLPTEQR